MGGNGGRQALAKKRKDDACSSHVFLLRSCLVFLPLQVMRILGAHPRFRGPVEVIEMHISEEIHWSE